MRFSAFVALRLFHATKSKRFPAGVLAACSASRAARFGSDAGKNPCGWHGKDQSTTRRDRRSEAFVLDLSRSHPAGVSRGKGKKKHTAKSPGCAPLPPLPQSVPACESVAPLPLPLPLQLPSPSPLLHPGNANLPIGALYLLSLLSRSGTKIGCAPGSSFRVSLSAVSHSCRASSFRPIAASASPRASCPAIEVGSIATASSASASAPAASPFPTASVAFCARLSAAACVKSNRPR